MNYEQMKKLDELIHFQIKFIDYMQELIEFDETYVKDNPNETLPPLQNIGVLKSHFTTQRKACDGVLSLTARHLPRLKAEHDKNKQVKKPIVKTTVEQVAKAKVENKPVPISTNFISLF
jgi:hypothetical protein